MSENKKAAAKVAIGNYTIIMPKDKKKKKETASSVVTTLTRYGFEIYKSPM